MPVKKGGRRPIDKIADPSYLEALGQRSVDEVRGMRGECAEEERLLSYERRLLHARLDIMREELERRHTGGETRPLVERLTQILTDERLPSRGAFPREEPPTLPDQPKRRVEKLISDDTLARLPDLAEEEIRSLLASAEELERQVSDDRRKVQDVLDALNGELVRRYQSGEADPTDVLTAQ